MHPQRYEDTAIVRRGAADCCQLRQTAAEGLAYVHQLTRRQVDRVFKLISARVARPHVPNTVIRQVLRPCRGDHNGTALRTLTD
jgi:hypothetical protein